VAIVLGSVCGCVTVVVGFMVVGGVTAGDPATAVFVPTAPAPAADVAPGSVEPGVVPSPPQAAMAQANTAES
jgi:hypothetical protein